MLDPNVIIAQSLAPAVAISGIAVLLAGLNTRIANVSGRVRELNRELRAKGDPDRAASIQRQIPIFLKRAYLIRNAMFLLCGALGFMMFSAFGIAMDRLGYVHWEMIPSWAFLGALGLVLCAVLIQACEIILTLRTLALDVESTVAFMSQPEGEEFGKP